MSLDKPSPIQPIISLHKNSTRFFSNFFEKYSNNMSCRLGCNKCCYVDLSIFQSEAYAILEWVWLLGDDEKQKLFIKLNKSCHFTQEKNENKSNAPCAFLSDGECAIYSVRPTICRTQGLPLQYKASEDKKNVQLVIDVCPLNFTEENSLPPRSEFLDLDRLNILQSIAENFFQQNKSEINLNDIEKIVNNQKRVPLNKLKEIILNYLKNN